MKRSLFISVLVLMLSIITTQYFVPDTVASESADTASLKATHQKYMQAWTDRDLDIIVDIGTGAAGFGHSTPFPRPVRVKETFGKIVQQFYDMMDVFTVTLITENYRVVGDTGLAWGHCSYTTKQKDGPQRTVYMRYAHTFARADGKWTLVMYHRSLVPTEDFQ